ncbi:MAG: hypothetical protein KF895_13465 [Parvibaculum sp.]|nr:hypothetical protein [Parvibaculum sp.]
MADEDILTYEGTALALDESSELANAFDTRVVLLMGERDAGKTTLLAEIHHAFLKAPFAGHLFAGSRTLLGFEQRCFLSRIASGESKEDTERTKSADVSLLHLTLAPEEAPDKHTHLLFTDVSGERFKEVRSSIEDARELAPLIRRADQIVLLVDGDRLTVPKTQMATRTNASTFLRCLLEAADLGLARALHIVVSKWDFVVARGAAKDVVAFEDAIRKAVRPLVPRFHRVAARVTNETELQAGFGLDALVAAVAAPREARSTQNNLVALPISSGRQFHRYRFPRSP